MFLLFLGPPYFKVTSLKMLTTLCFLLVLSCGRFACKTTVIKPIVMLYARLINAFPEGNFTGEGLLPLETVMSRKFDVANLVYDKSWQTVTEEIPAKENVLTVSSWIYLFRRCTLVPSSSIFSSKTVTEWIADTLGLGCCCRFVLVHWICVRISACARIPRARVPKCTK